MNLKKLIQRFLHKAHKGGRQLEEYFLEAANQLHYVVVTETNPRFSITVRHATLHEDFFKKTDFVFTYRKGDEIHVIPLQLTLLHDTTNPKLGEKLRLAEDGYIALFWPGHGLTDKQFFQMIKRAASGDSQALRDLKLGLDLAFEKYLEKQTNSVTT